MATKRSCDRCGIDIAPGAPYSEMRLCDFRSFLGTYDLCESCMRSAREWMDEFASAADREMEIEMAPDDEG